MTDNSTPPEPPYTCDLFAALAEQLTDEQRGELEVIRQEVLKLRAWGRAQTAAERERCAKYLDDLRLWRTAFDIRTGVHT